MNGTWRINGVMAAMGARCEELIAQDGRKVAQVEDFGYAIYPRAFNEKTQMWERHGPTQDRNHAYWWCETVSGISVGRPHMTENDWQLIEALIKEHQELQLSGLASVAANAKRAKKRKLYGWEGERFDFYWWHNGWRHINFGFHVHLGRPFNIEVHLPGGFLRFGFTPPDTRLIRRAAKLDTRMTDLLRKAL